jgi:hypothetical protein
MDGHPEAKFGFQKLLSTVDDFDSEWQPLLRITCDFQIHIRGRKFYSELSFPVVEFASQASRWLRVDGGDFRYESMESDVSPLIAFRRLDDDEFIAYSPHQEFEAPEHIGRRALRDALINFVANLKTSVRAGLGVQVNLDRFF